MRIVFAIAALALIAAGPAGHIYDAVYICDHNLYGSPRPYCPEAGDIIFFTDDDCVFWDCGFKLAGTGHPYHSGLIVPMPDGTLGVLESGPDDSNLVEVSCIYERLRFHSCNRGRVWVRKRICPITPEQSARLTEFALCERHKKYALLRMAGQVTLFRSRGPVRTEFMGGCQGRHKSYFCSECVLEAAAYAGLIDPETTRPRATYPRDFFFDSSHNRYLNKHMNFQCSWEPPARWQPFDCPCCKAWQGSFRHPNPEGIPVHPYFLNCDAQTWRHNK